MLIQHGNFSKNALVLLENCKICKKIVDVRCVKEKKKIGMMDGRAPGIEPGSRTFEKPRALLCFFFIFVY